jgi:hypothetical protein
MKIILKLHSKMQTKDWVVFYFNMNLFRHLKHYEKRFNETLNSTRFGLKARVSYSEGNVKCIVNNR